MKTPKELQPLLDDGIIDGVLRRLKSGKEATVYLVDCGGRIRCAKVYKDSQQRGFHKLAEYQEGRTVRGIPSHTVSQGKLVFVQGDLRAERGVGRYIKRPAFSANFHATQLRAQALQPTAVAR